MEKDYTYSKDRLYLIGLMGAGKTTIGRQLARKLHLEFYDSDREIEARTGVSIPTVFEIEGEEGFRRREAQVIAGNGRSAALHHRDWWRRRVTAGKP